MRRLVSVLVVFAVLVVAQGVFANDGANHASAVLRDANGQEIGFADFVEDAPGLVHVDVHVKGVTPGLHGIHLHAVGSCVPPTFASAGGHFNPMGEQHGLENPNGPHAGDLPNLVVNESGVGHLDTTTDRVTLSAGPMSLFDADGTALVIHAHEDDQMTNPSGNSGSRIACGVIEAAHR